jgi:hypothetical protein
LRQIAKNNLSNSTILSTFKKELGQKQEYSLELQSSTRKSPSSVLKV